MSGREAIVEEASRVQALASDPMASAWVTANAGSGKTKVLIDRVARLLLGSGSGPAVDPSNILCLTFTRAAAANMQNRLFARLGKWALLGDEALYEEIARLFGPGNGAQAGAVDLAAARRLFAQALETPGGLKIQTIHAFSEALLRRFPLEAGVSPHFNLLDEVESRGVVRRARDKVIAEALAEEGTALRQAVDSVLRGAQESGIDALCAEIVAKRGAFSGDPERLLAGVHGTLSVVPGTTEADAIGTFHAEVPPELIKRIADAFAKGGVVEKKFCAEAYPALERADREAWFVALKAALLTQKGEPRSKMPTANARKADPGIADAVADLQGRLAALAERLVAIRAAEDAGSLLAFAQALLAQIDREKAARDALDFDDLILRAGALLNERDESAWVRYKLDGGVDHILVDEAQDTSPAQWRAISAIAEEFFAGDGARDVHRTLFVVGDDKQSIFSFQGADPAELDRVREQFASLVAGAQQEMRRPELRHSFRSAPAILEAVDRVFSRPDAHAGLSVAGGAPAHVGSRQTAPGRVEFWPPVCAEQQADETPWWEPVDKPPTDAPHLRLARGIVVRIGEWISEGTILEARGRPIRPGDILILVRRRNVFSTTLIRMLKNAGLPVTGADRMKLADQLAVKDLLALAKFVLLPDDDLMLATVLRSPIVGFSEEHLEDLAAGRERRLLWRELVRRREDSPHLGEAHGMLAALLGDLGFLRPYDFLEAVLTRFGARERLLRRLGSDASDPIDELLAQALDYERNGAPTLEGFVAHIEAAQLEVKREMEQGRDEIRVMTVHGSKGLEANIVILPDICAMPKTSDPPRVMPLPAGGALWMPSAEAAPQPMRDRKDAAKALAYEEYRRLLYVGMTRARDCLIVCGWFNREEPKPDSWLRLVEPALGDASLDRIQTPLLDAQGAPLEGFALANPGESEPDTEEGAEALLRPEAPPEALRSRTQTEISTPPLAPSRAAEDEPFLPRPAPSEYEDTEASMPARERGTRLHALLEALSRLAPDRRAEAVARSGNPLAGQALRLLDNPRFAWMFGPGSRAEVPVAGPVSALGGREILGAIDRLVVRDRRADIVDLKSGAAHDPAPEAYLRQLAIYRAALMDILPGHEIAAHLFWIDLPRLDTPEPDVLDAALARVPRR